MELSEKLNRAALALAAIAGLASCAPEEESCDAVAGTYQPIYVMRSGNCGEVAPTSLPLDGGESGVKTTTVMELGRDIVTSVVHTGCRLRVTQDIVSKQGMRESTMNGGEIAVHSSQQLSGQVHYQRFTLTVPQTMICEGMYEATFTRPDSVVGPTY